MRTRSPRGAVAIARVYLASVTCAAAFFARSASAQPARRPAATDLPAAARTIIADAKYATFITTDSAGHPQARTVQPAAPDAQWHVWIATNPRTRKVGEVQRDAHVALHYFDRATESYVTVIGVARVVRDRATKDAHWDPAWTAFYKDRDAGVVLIDVRAERLEIVSEKLGITGDAATWRPPSVQVGVPR